MAELPISPLDRIIRKQGENVRVSGRAPKKLRKILEDYATKVSEFAVKLAERTGRITVKRRDIKLALDQQTL